MAVELGQLRGERVDLTDIGVHGLTGFGIQQLKLRGQFSEARGQAVCVSQEQGAGHHRRRVGREFSRRLKETVHGHGQANAVPAHDINQAIHIRQQGRLTLQVAVAVAQIGVDKGVVLALDRVKTCAGADVATTHLSRLVGHQGHVLPRVPIGTDVGNVVGHRGQRPLVSGDAR